MVSFRCADEEEVRFLQEDLEIHHLTLEDVVNQNQRPKVESFEDYVYIAIHPLMHKKKWQIEPSELDLLLGRHWIVSVHYGPLPGLIENSHIHERLANALGRGTDSFLYTLVDLVVDSYFPILDEIEDEIGSLEDRLLAQAKSADMNRLLAFKRSLVHVRRTVGPQREVFNQLRATNSHSFARKIWFTSVTFMIICSGSPRNSTASEIFSQARSKSISLPRRISST